MSRDELIEQRTEELASVNEWSYSDDEIRQFALELIEQNEQLGGHLTDEEISDVDVFIFKARGMFRTKKLHLSLGIKPGEKLEALDTTQFKLVVLYIEAQLFRLDQSEIQQHRVCCQTSRYVLQWIPHAKMFIYVR